ncbi:MAG: hypothetical protein HOW97_22190 [Catenulispora sp.]|nr:hypothetical protein [Catenulispora sp.]
MMGITAKKVLNVCAAAALAGAAGACSSGGPAKTGAVGAAAASSSAGASAPWVAYASCMRDHGIAMPDPQPGGQITVGDQAKDDGGKLDAAMAACRSLLPAGKGAAPQSDADRQREIQRARCLRSHGVPVQDPQPGQDLVVTGSHLDPAAVQAAMAACRSGS